MEDNEEKRFAGVKNGERISPQSLGEHLSKREGSPKGTGVIKTNYRKRNFRDPDIYGSIFIQGKEHRFRGWMQFDAKGGVEYSLSTDIKKPPKNIKTEERAQKRRIRVNLKDKDLPENELFE